MNVVAPCIISPGIEPLYVSWVVNWTLTGGQVGGQVKRGAGMEDKKGKA